MLQREHARPDNQRITAGIPSLSSDKRRDITERQLLYLYQKECQRQYSDNESAAKAPDGAIGDVTDPAQITGIAMSGWKVAARILKLARQNGNILYTEIAKADSSIIGIYHPNMEPKFLTSWQAEWCPEFSLRVVDDNGNLKGTLGGWRRALMRLIRMKIITESGAHMLFGPPSRDSENWARFTQ